MVKGLARILLRAGGTRPLPDPVFFSNPESPNLGQPESAEVAKAMYHEIEQRVDRKEGFIPDEKCRLNFSGFRCWPKMGFLSSLLPRSGAVVVGGMYTDLFWYPYPDVYNAEHPLEFIAINAVRASYNCNLAVLVDRLSEQCQRQQIDGLIIFKARTCRLYSDGDKNLLQVRGSIGESAVVCQGQT